MSDLMSLQDEIDAAQRAIADAQKAWREGLAERVRCAAICDFSGVREAVTLIEMAKAAKATALQRLADAQSALAAGRAAQQAEEAEAARTAAEAALRQRAEHAEAALAGMQRAPVVAPDALPPAALEPAQAQQPVG